MSAIKSVLGLMSGTSLDGIDLAVMQTDGEQRIEFSRDGFVPYSAETRRLLRAVLDDVATRDTSALKRRRSGLLVEAEVAVTKTHIDAVQNFLTPDDAIDLIGFHGQTIIHRPDEGFTLQIGDGQALAEALSIDVVGQFRLADMAAGGQGAPLAPLYHAALIGDARPQAVLNLGGVANMTWLGAGDAILAFDTGPANALLDDWVKAKTGNPFDQDGALAARGTVDESVLDMLLAHDYFDRPPPKSLDRLSFPTEAVNRLSPEDGAATLTAFSAAAVAHELAFCPQLPEQLILCGGGRHNPTLCAMLAARYDITMVDCDSLGWRGDSLEAQAFAWLAMRAVKGLPLSRPETTAVRAPCSGGDLYRAGS